MGDIFTYHFDASLGILFKTYYGLVTIEDINGSWNTLLKMI